MKKNKVMFIPADPTLIYYVTVRKEYTTEYGGMNKAQLVLDHQTNKGHHAVCVWYDGKPDPFVSSLDTGEIYVRGHGNAGDDHLHMAKSGGENIPYDVVVERLIATGLKKSFNGVIKCWNCHSAEATKTGDAFAQLFTDALYAHGYKFCTVYGYVHAIDSFPKKGSEGIGNYARESDGITEIGKAKAFRQLMKPRPRAKLALLKNNFRSLFRKHK